MASGPIVREWPRFRLCCRAVIHGTRQRELHLWLSAARYAGGVFDINPAPTTMSTLDQMVTRELIAIVEGVP